MEEDELVIFLLPMPVSLPGGEVGVSASFRMISFSFEAIILTMYILESRFVIFHIHFNVLNPFRHYLLNSYMLLSDVGK